MRRLSENRNIFDVAERFSDSHDGNLTSVFGIGIVAAAAIAIYGLSCVFRQDAIFFASRPIKVVHYAGTPAVCLGAAYISLAVFLHAHFTWSGSERFHAFGQVGKLISLSALLASIGYLLFHAAAYS